MCAISPTEAVHVTPENSCVVAVVAEVVEGELGAADAGEVVRVIGGGRRGGLQGQTGGIQQCGKMPSAAALSIPDTITCLCFQWRIVSVGKLILLYYHNIAL